jgi:RNA polymerase sigma factor (sigma-70 family)
MADFFLGRPREAVIPRSMHPKQPKLTGAEAIDDFRNLVRQVREGSQDAARELVLRYGRAIRRAVRRKLNDKLRPKFDSLDFVQVVWNSFFRVPDKLEQIESPEELMKYLLAVTRHKVDHENRRYLALVKHNVNRERSLERLPKEQRAALAAPDPEPVDMAVAHEQWDRMLDGLPPRCRQIVEMRLQGCSTNVIAQELQMTDRAVRRVLEKLLQNSSR